MLRTDTVPVCRVISNPPYRYLSCVHIVLSVMLCINIFPVHVVLSVMLCTDSSGVYVVLSVMHAMYRQFRCPCRVISNALYKQFMCPCRVKCNGLYKHWSFISFGFSSAASQRHTCIPLSVDKQHCSVSHDSLSLHVTCNDWGHRRAYCLKINAPTELGWIQTFAWTFIATRPVRAACHVSGFVNCQYLKVKYTQCLAELLNESLHCMIYILYR